MNAYDFIIAGLIAGLFAVAYFIVVFIKTINWKKDPIVLKIEAILGVVICSTIGIFIITLINCLLTIN